jgi:hypothetical protein
MMAEPVPQGPLPQSQPDRGDLGAEKYESVNFHTFRGNIGGQFQPDAPARIGQSQPENALFRVSGWLTEPLLPSTYLTPNAA